MSQTEITTPVPALNESGRPCNFGWARSQVFTYDGSQLRSPRRRISEGERYILISPSHMVLFEIEDDGYLGYVFISVISLKNKNHFTKTIVNAFPMGSFNLPPESDSGSIKFKQEKSLLNFVNMDGGVKIIKADLPKFSHRFNLRGEVVLSPHPEAESLLTHMPWRGKGDAFSYSRRSPCYSAEGVIQFGITEIVFSRGNSWGIFEWSRGVRPRNDLSFRAAGSGKVDERLAGFSVGYNTADATMGTENAFFLDGRLHKLDKVSFHIPSGKLEPWRFTSNDNRLEMSFYPQQERDENHQMFFYSQKRRQLFGSFSGTVTLDDGNEFFFQDITGMAERQKNRL